MARGRKAPAATFEDVLSALERGDLDLVYILYGPEQFLIEQALGLLRAALEKEDPSLSYEVLRADETSGRAIVASARTAPMFSLRRLVVVRGASALKQADLEELATYIADPAPTSCLALVAEKVDRRLRFFSEAGKLGFLHEASALPDRLLPQWIEEQAQSRSLKLDRDASLVLAEAIGSDLTLIEDALERLALYAQGRGAVTAADVEEVVLSTRIRSVFELTDALGGRDLAGALSTLAHVLEQREHPLRLLATLATHVRRLLAVRELGRSGAPRPENVAERFGIPPFVARKLVEQSRMFSPEELRRALVRLARADLDLKGSRIPEPLLLEALLIDLCRPEEKGGDRGGRGAVRRAGAVRD